jgi:hypothetical protein
VERSVSPTQISGISPQRDAAATFAATIASFSP